MVMGGRRDGDGLACGVNMGFAQGFINGGKMMGYFVANGFSSVEKGPAPLFDGAGNRSGDNIPRGQIQIFMDPFHQASVIFIDQYGAIAAQGLGGQRCRIATNIHGGRVELHKFRIHDGGSGPIGHGDTMTLSMGWVCGDGIKPANAPGCQYNISSTDKFAFFRINIIGQAGPSSAIV